MRDKINMILIIFIKFRIGIWKKDIEIVFLVVFFINWIILYEVLCILKLLGFDVMIFLFFYCNYCE